MTLNVWLMIAAVLLAPLIAVQVQKYLEVLREKRQKKIGIFQTLMATRAARLSAQHVQALNMIDIEFYGRKIIGYRYQSRSEKEITDAWKVYLDHLYRPDVTESELKAWTEKGADLFVELLHRMAQHLGYDFDKVHLNKGIYSPRAHGEEELEQLFIRKAFVEILQGKKAFPMAVVSFPYSQEDAAKQREATDKLIEYLDGKRAVKVNFKKDD